MFGQCRSASQERLVLPMQLKAFWTTPASEHISSVTTQHVKRRNLFDYFNRTHSRSTTLITAALMLMLDIASNEMDSPAEQMH